MNIWRAVSFVAVLLNLGLSSQPARKITVDDLMRLRTIVDVKISPDGTSVAYAVSQPSVERDAHETELFVAPAAGGSPKRLAPDTRIFTPTLPAPRLRWTPDGSRVSFLSVVNGRPQVFAAAVDANAQQITSAPQGAFPYEWAPDAKSVAYLSRDEAPASVVTHVHAPPPSTRLWVQPLDGTAYVVVTPSAHYVDSFTWAPDSASIVYSAAPMSGFTAPYYTRLFRASVGTPGTSGTLGTAVTPIVLIDRPGMNTMPQFSPDGSRIAFVTTNERVGLLAPRILAVADLGVRSGGASAPPSAPAIRTYPMNGAWIGEMTWAPDGKSLYVLMNEDTFATQDHMFEMPIVRVDVASGTSDRVVSGPIVDYSMSVSRDGRTLAYREVEPRSMGEVIVRDVATGRTRKITDVNPELAQFALGKLEAIKWRSFDGMELWGLLITPPVDRGPEGPPLRGAVARSGGDFLSAGASAKAEAPPSSPRTFPLITYCHGGPIGGVTYGIFPQFMHVPGQIDPYPVEALASAGYAVFLPMPRGGSGYGEQGHRAIVNAWGEADYKDIMAGIDHLIAQGVADPDRLGIMGASYGGYMTNWIVTQTNRFKAASSSASVSDLTDLYYLADAGAVMEEYFKKPWENRDSYAAHSPITYVERVTTPLLLQHGENDPRVPLASARKFYEALKALGKTVEFDIFPRGSHVQYQPVAERESMQRNLEWFRRWIKP